MFTFEGLPIEFQVTSVKQIESHNPSESVLAYCHPFISEFDYDKCSKVNDDPTSRLRHL